MIVTYRQASAADLPALSELGREVNLLHHLALPRVFARPEDTAATSSLWPQDDLAPHGAVFVAARENRIIGFISGQIEDETASHFVPVRYCSIGTLAVTESERGRGIGRGLVDTLERWAVLHQAVEVHLNVWAFNTRAAELYQELGYEIRAHFMVKGLR